MSTTSSTPPGTSGRRRHQHRSSYIPIINIDNAEQFVGNYAFQLIVYKTSTFAGYDDACQAYNLSQDQILSNVVQDPNDPENPFVLNPVCAQSLRPQRERREPLRAQSFRVESLRPQLDLHHGAAGKRNQVLDKALGVRQ